jgi:hypothetical protein
LAQPFPVYTNTTVRLLGCTVDPVGNTVLYIPRAMMRRVDGEKSIFGDRARGAKIGPSEKRGRWEDE